MSRISAGPPIDLPELSLLAAAEQSCAVQWRFVLPPLVQALFGRLGEDETLALLGHVGESAAAGLRLPACEALPDLEREINDLLDRMQWGRLSLAEGDQALVCTLVGYPVIDGTDEGLALVVALFEGMLTRWLAAQGGAGLRARFAERGPGRYPPLVFHYGRNVG